jgi:hypothetical protein
MKYASLKKLLSFSCYVIVSISTVLGMDQNEESRGNITRFRSAYCQGDDGESEWKTVSDRLSLITNAFQDEGLMPHIALDNGNNEVSVFATLPLNFLTFVSWLDDVPRSGPKNGMSGMRERAKHCDFSKTLNYANKEGFHNASISSMHCSFSVPDISLSLWCYIEAEKKQIFISPTSAIFHIHIYRSGEKMHELKRGLENCVSGKMKNGFYVVVPEGAVQINWQENPHIINIFCNVSNNFHYKWQQR